VDRGIYATTNPLCANWDWEKERRRLEKMAYSFVNKFSDYADRLPPDLYAAARYAEAKGSSTRSSFMIGHAVSGITRRRRTSRMLPTAPMTPPAPGATGKQRPGRGSASYLSANCG
jgi:hypothetical protein